MNRSSRNGSGDRRGIPRCRPLAGRHGRASQMTRRGRRQVQASIPWLITIWAISRRSWARRQKASEYYQLAVACRRTTSSRSRTRPLTCCGPAIKANPRDARAPYYLGNVLYDWQPEEATRLWQASEPLSTPLLRSSIAIWPPPTRISNPAPTSIRPSPSWRKRFRSNRKYALHFTELDELYEQAGIPLEKRLPLFRQNAAVVARRDDAHNRAVALKVATGQVDDAIRMMTGPPSRWPKAPTSMWWITGPTPTFCAPKQKLRLNASGKHWPISTPPP